jgi:hypothetical protein
VYVERLESSYTSDKEVNVVEKQLDNSSNMKFSHDSKIPLAGIHPREWKIYVHRVIYDHSKYHYSQ